MTVPPPGVAASPTADRAQRDEASARIALSDRRRRHRGRTVVVKVGGHALTDATLTSAFAKDVALLREAGLRPVVVHGGGPQVSEELLRRGLVSEFKAGLRVTPPAAMDVIRMVLAGRVQRELVGLINRHGPRAVGLTGEDADFMTAARHVPLIDGEPVDIGRVGEIVGVDVAVIRLLVAAGRIPVISSVARAADDGSVYNVNADLAAAAVAVALRTPELVVVTDVEGLYADWPRRDRVVERVTAAEVEKLLPYLSGGMLPKMSACLTAVRGGVGQARLVDGRVANALLSAFSGGAHGGTVVVPG